MVKTRHSDQRIDHGDQVDDDRTEDVLEADESGEDRPNAKVNHVETTADKHDIMNVSVSA